MVKMQSAPGLTNIHHSDAWLYIRHIPAYAHMVEQMGIFSMYREGEDIVFYFGDQGLEMGRGPNVETAVHNAYLYYLEAKKTKKGAVCPT